MSSNLADKITEHMEVVASDGAHVGTVDHVQGDQIKLTRNDSTDNKHHLISTSLISAVDTKVHLSRPIDQVRVVMKEE